MDILNINGEFDFYGLDKLTWPIAWSGEPDRKYEAALAALVQEAREVLKTTPDCVAVKIVDGEIAEVLVES